MALSGSWRCSAGSALWKSAPFGTLRFISLSDRYNSPAPIAILGATMSQGSQSGKPTVVLDARSMARTLRRMADEVVELFSGTDDLILVGIQRRGVQLAERIATFIDERENVRIARGALDITLYRDDLQTIGPRPVVGKTSLPLSLDGRNVVIVDDVLYIGRTVRAAMDELADFGRPARIALAVLVDRGGRELPIHADVVGKTVQAASHLRVDVQISDLDGEDSVIIVPRDGEG